MDWKDNGIDIKKEIQDWKEENGDQVAMLSTIDHILTKATPEERYNSLIAITEDDIAWMDFSVQINMAGTIEYACNEFDKKPPSWVMDKKYTYETPEESDLYKKSKDIHKSAGPGYEEAEFHRVFMDSFEDETLPQFKWRNLMCDGIFDSF